MVSIELRLHLGGNVGFFVGAATGTACVDVRLLVEQIDDAVEVGAFPDRHFDRNDLVGELGLDLSIDGVEVGVLLIHHRDDEEHGIAPLHRLAEHSFGPDFHPAGGSDHTQRAVRGGETGNRVSLEVQKARRVQHVDLAVHPLRVGAAEIDRVPAFDLFGSGVGEGGALGDASVASTRAGHESERIDQTGLAARPVSNHRDVADFRSVVRSHA